MAKKLRKIQTEDIDPSDTNEFPADEQWCKESIRADEVGEMPAELLGASEQTPIETKEDFAAEPQPPKEQPRARKAQVKQDWRKTVQQAIWALADEDANDATVITLAVTMSDVLEESDLPSNARTWIAKAERILSMGEDDAIRRARNALQVAYGAESVPD